MVLLDHNYSANPETSTNTDAFKTTSKISGNCSRLEDDVSLQPQVTSKPKHNLQRRIVAVKVSKSKEKTSTRKSNSSKEQLSFDPISGSFVLSVKKCSTNVNRYDGNTQSYVKDPSSPICQKKLINNISKVSMAKNQTNLTAKVNSKNATSVRRKASEMEPELSKNKGNKRRINDSLSSSCELSVHATKKSTVKAAKVKKIISKESNEKELSLGSVKKTLKASQPHRKSISSEELNGIPEKAKKKLFISEINLKKQGAINLKDAPNLPSKPKPKVKKKIIKSDNFDLDLLGPALFSQPHVMGKVKAEDISSAKEISTTPKDLSKETIIKQCDLSIKPENQMDGTQNPQEDIKSDGIMSPNATSKIDNVATSLCNDETESPKVKKMPAKDIATPICKNTAKEKKVTSDLNVTDSVSVKVIDINKTQTMEKNTNKIQVITESLISSPKSSCKIDTSIQSERKSQRNLQKRKRTYEEDSDFEEPPTAIKKNIVEETKPERREIPQRAQRQRSTSKMENLLTIENEQEEQEEEEESDEESDSSSSDDDSDSEEEEENDEEKKDNEDDKEEEAAQDSDDDPDKLWCICRKPHNNKFMICCDKCEDWFHGTCVGISRKMGNVLETEKTEWLCPNCKKGIIPEWRKQPSAKAKKNATNDNKKKIEAKANKSQSSTKRGRKDSVKTSAPEKDITIDITNNENLTKQSTDKNVDNGSNNTKSHLLRKLVERKEVILMKREPKLKKAPPPRQASPQKVLPKKEMSPEKVNVEVLPKSSANKEKPIVTKNKTMSIKECATSEKSNMPSRSAGRSAKIQNVTPDKPQARVLITKASKSQKDDQKMKPTKELTTKKRLNCIICSQPVTNAPPQSVYCGFPCLEKHAENTLQVILNQKGFLEDQKWKNKKIVVYDHQTGTLVDNENAPRLGNILKWLKSNPNYEIMCPPVSVPKKDKESHRTESKSHTKSDQKSHSKTEKSQAKIDSKIQATERNERSEDSDDSAKENIRKIVRNALKGKLLDRCKSAEDLNVAEEEVEKIAVAIENELNKHLKDTPKYMKKYRSLLFNIQDSRNEGLFRKIISGEITPDHLVKMSTEELAAPELAQWRAKETQHSLEMIKRMQVDQQTSAAGLRKKTHKGEIEIEGDVPGREAEIDKEVVVTPPRPVEETIEITSERKEPEKKEEDNDTTNFHRSHLFDLNCKICTGKMPPPGPEEPATKKVRVAHSISMEQSSPKHVSSNLTVEKLAKSMIINLDGTDDFYDQELPTIIPNSPDVSNLQPHPAFHRKKSSYSVWKGFVIMQDIAKFFTNAYKVSGPTDFMLEDIPDTIQVCGRIDPALVWDYLTKTKQSGNKELVVIRFQATNDEESVQYNNLYTYLYTKKRHGVINSNCKMIKDFYIFPLAAHNPVPTVLLPFEGPGLPSHRPHLLLGIIVRHRMRHPVTSISSDTQEPEVLTLDGSYTPPLETRSYTPPLPSTSGLNEMINDQSLTPPPFGITSGTDDTYDPSYTPPMIEVVDIDDKPYDPEEESGLTNSDVQSILMDSQAQIQSPVSNPNVYQNAFLQKEALVLTALKRLNEEVDRKVTSLETELADQNVADLSSESNTIDGLMIPTIGASGMSSFLDLPNDLHEILTSVRQNLPDSPNLLQQSEKDVDIRCLPQHPNIDVDLRCITESERDEDIRQVPRYSPITRIVSYSSEEIIADADERGSSQGATPTASCDDDDNSSSSEVRRSDPRIKIRTNFVEASPEETRKVSLSDMSTSELMERAQKELESIPTTRNQGAISSVSADGITMEHYQQKGWEQYTEPPPPGIDPSELPPVEKVGLVGKTTSAYGLPSENQVSIASFPPHPPPTSPVFPVPPAGFPISTPPPPVSMLPPAFLIPPPPIAPTIAPSPNETSSDDQFRWPESHSTDSEWRERPRSWRDREWNERRRQPHSNYHRDRQNDRQRGRFRQNFYRNEHSDNGTSRGWRDEESDRQYNRSERRSWYPRRGRDNRHHDNFRGRRNFKRSHE